jgi:hypothetical protein
MNIVFFDVDGVLNSKEWLMQQNTALKKGEAGGIDPLALARFNLIASVAETTNTIFICSSSWRREGLDHIRSVFDEVGFKGYIAGVTPAYNDLSRGHEIQDTVLMLTDCGVVIDRVVVIDNEPSAAMPNLEHMFVYTNYLEGLTEQLAIEARHFLLTGGKPNDQ